MKASSSTKDLVISVIVPVYNQGEKIATFVDETLAVLRANFSNYELILVDDASRDRTAEIIRSEIATTQNVRLLVLARHQGTEIALTAGLDCAIGDYVVLMSRDLLDPPTFLAKLVARAQQGYDVVYVGKTAEEMRGRFLYRIASHFFYRLIGHLTGFSVPEDASDFRILSRRVVNSVTRLKEQNRSTRIMFAYMGYATDTIRLDVPRSQTGDNPYPNYAEKLALACDAIIAFSNRPLRYVSIMSITISVVAFLWAASVVVERLLSNEIIEGWASLMVALLFMFCLLFFFLSILSEYIARILVESKNRPLYYIRDEYGSTKAYAEDIVDIV